jgi:hypothetical protein
MSPIYMEDIGPDVPDTTVERFVEAVNAAFWLEP